MEVTGRFSCMTIGARDILNRLPILVLISSLMITPNALAGMASKLFGDHKQKVFQIRVIDIASGNKSSIGSGFQVNKNGLVATNYHVVASYIHKPDKFRLEAVNHNNVTDDVKLLGIDVIHDLAILKLKTLRQGFFRFNHATPSKGDRIYSMGNPHDLAMTIIEGNYNGLIKTSRFQKILFSGSLNAGMSGGPAFDETGRIIGVNVSKGSEQLSFLVPVRELAVLLRQVVNKDKTAEFEKNIAQSLAHDQETFYGRLFSRKWGSEPFMELILPSTISQSLKCWGHTVDKKDILYEGVHQHCRSQDEIYLSQQLFTGSFFYDYEWMATKELNRIQFYNLIEKRFNHGSLRNAHNEEDITNFNCNTSFVEISDQSWRVSSCVRAYKKYAGLYDTVLMLASVDENHKGIVIKVGAAGISQANADKLARAFLGAVQWPR